MNIFWAIVGIGWLILFGALAFWLWRAPAGYEDSDGFHEGMPPEVIEQESNRDVA